MKAFFVFLVFIASVSSYANIDSIKFLLDQKEVKKLEERLKGQSFTLSKIEDVYAESGVRPRCPCESYSLTFSKIEYVLESTKKTVEIYSVKTSGFGTDLKFTINKEN
jgi:hypothetical protein